MIIYNTYICKVDKFHGKLHDDLILSVIFTSKS